MFKLLITLEFLAPGGKLLEREIIKSIDTAAIERCADHLYCKMDMQCFVDSKLVWGNFQEGKMDHLQQSEYPPNERIDSRSATIIDRATKCLHDD